MGRSAPKKTPAVAIVVFLTFPFIELIKEKL